jgi:copper chaperone CopZ
MRMLLVAVLVVGCQHDVAQQSAAAEKIVVASKPAAVPRIETPDLATQQTGQDKTAKHACADEEGANEPSPTWAVLPANTPWTALHVTGMHCGECAKKIERALAKVDGVRGVKIDLATQKVEIAVSDGHDARTIAKPVIDGLGYHVD